MKLIRTNLKLHFMKKLKLIIWLVLVSAGVMSFVWKFEMLKKEGPKQELLILEKNEDFELSIYREKFITGIVYESSAYGPHMLQKSGNLKEVISELMDYRDIELDFRDDRHYNLEIKTSKPIKLIQNQIAEFTLNALDLTIQNTIIDLDALTITIQDFEKAQEAQKEMKPGMLTYKEVKNNRIDLLGYTAKEIADELGDLFPEIYFSFPENFSNQPLYISLSDISDLAKVKTDLKRQGIILLEEKISKDIMLVQKKHD